MVDGCVCYIVYVSLRVTSVTDWCGFVTKSVNCHVILCNVILCNVMQWMKVRGAWVGTEYKSLGVAQVSEVSDKFSSERMFTSGTKPTWVGR